MLEVGTGSGYFAALLAARTEWVRTIEIESELVKLASANLARNGVENVVVVQGDGIGGWAERAPYDVIVVSGGLPFVPQALLEQLKVGGRLFAFVGEAPVMKRAWSPAKPKAVSAPKTSSRPWCRCSRMHRSATVSASE